ncbi:alpha/beta hydrolase [Halobacillus rhizosphaerae]|uniref:alpha/beta hydrolase n=1 Tax=Halobacillus rhizosphaerae TaxID=3064889 RepID=UPI00398B72B5
MKHIFKAGKEGNHKTLLMLHGTGGTENDLLQVAELIDPNAAVLSVRGNVLEQGMSRFFKRLREGVFDEEDLKKQTNELNTFLAEAAEEYSFDRRKVIAVGYSNGANIAGSLLFHFQDSLEGALLFHPMVPIRGVDLPNLTGTPIFIGAGENDPICSSEETKELHALLQSAGAEVKVHWEERGHQLTQSEVLAAKDWYKELFSAQD